MRTTTVDVDARVVVRSWGAGRPIVFLHAMGPVSSGALVAAGVEPLVSAGFEVTAPDLPGYGDTPALPADDYRLGPLARWMWRVVDAIGRDQVTLVGHSWGGAIACHMHAARPERVEALVLVDSGHLDYADVLGDQVAMSIDDWMEESRGRRLRVADAAALAKELELDADDTLLDLLLVGMEYEADSGDMVSRVSPEAQGRARYHLAQARQSETWPTIAAGGTPTLLLLATEPGEARAQNEAAARRFQAAVPHADIRLVPGATHSMVTDLRAEFGAIVADWLTSSSAR